MARRVQGATGLLVVLAARIPEDSGRTSRYTIGFKTVELGAMNPDWIDLQRFIREGQAAATLSSNPMSAALGMRIEQIDLAKGEIRLSFEPQGLFIQGAGVLQGGAISAMLDFAMAFAVMATLPERQSCATSSLNISFLRPAPKGRYVAVGETERRGKALAFTRARLYQEGADDHVVATATSLLALFQLQSNPDR